MQTWTMYATSGGLLLYRGVGDALVLMAPNHQVQEGGKAGLADAVLGALRVGSAVLVQHQHVDPLIPLELCRVLRPTPAYPPM